MDDAAREEIRRIMGVTGLQTPDGRSVASLQVERAQLGLFQSGPSLTLAPCPPSETGESLAKAIVAAGFIVTSEILPGPPRINQLTRRPSPDGLVVGDREVIRDGGYDRLTRWVTGSLALAWIILVLAVVVADRSFWGAAVFGGGFFLGLPAYVISSYRGSGYTSLVVVAHLESLVELGPVWDGSIKAFPLRVTLYGARVASHATVGRNLGARTIRSASMVPEVPALLESIFAQWRRAVG